VKCATCEAATISNAIVFCPRCSRAYDRWQRTSFDTGTHAALIRWVADRVRKHERDRMKRVRDLGDKRR
jgi:hypothetical protein